MSAFGTVLKDIRSTHGLSQQALAARLGSTQRHVSFVETGRSQPTDYFVTRLCRTLDLTLAQRANLFEAAGLPAVYLQRDLDSDEVRAALDMLDSRVLAHWPFPALVLDPAWTIQRANTRFHDVFGPMFPPSNTVPSLLDLLLEPQVRARITNWPQAVEMFYYRMQSAATRHAQAAEVFARARASGMFEVLPSCLSDAGPAPVFIPLRFALPNGQNLEMTSLVGRLASAHDCLVEGLEVELFVPCDATSEAVLSRSN
ncbi:MAG: helix-turn-helix domain-containing protein [Pseudomonadota bacterium]